MAHTKAGGATSLGRDSHGQRLGVKMFAGQFIKPGMIIVRQRGSKFRPGENVRQGSDDTLYSVASGYLKFSSKKIKKYNGDLQLAKFVHVLPTKPEKAAAKAAAVRSKK